MSSSKKAACSNYDAITIEPAPFYGDFDELFVGKCEQSFMDVDRSKEWPYKRYSTVFNCGNSPIDPVREGRTRTVSRTSWREARSLST